MSQAEGSSQRSGSRSKTDAERNPSGTGTISSASGEAGSGKRGNGAKQASSRDKGSTSAADVQAKAEQLADSARAQAKGELMTQKDRVAGTIGVLAGALHGAGDQFRGNDDEKMASYVDAAADRMDEFASSLRNQDIGQLVHTVQRFGREQPGMFLAATFALGFAAARFLKSSTQPRSGTSGAGGMWAPGSWDRSPDAGIGRFDAGPFAAASGSAGSGTSGVGSSTRQQMAESDRGGLGDGPSTDFNTDWQTGSASRAGGAATGGTWASGAYDTGPEG